MIARSKPVAVPFRHAVPAAAVASVLQQLLGDSPGVGRVMLVVERNQPDHGPGTELKRLLGRFGITVTPTCQCNARAAEMDRAGCDWCEANVEKLVGWLREEAERRGLPFIDAAGRMLVRRAITTARNSHHGKEANAAG